MESLPVSDLGHMDRLYLWREGKRGRRVHIENPGTERAYCQIENCSGGRALDGRGAEVPAGRRICGNCVDLMGRNEADYREPSLAVLLGERTAEAEPELFTSTVMSKPSKREKPARPAHTRSRKLRRSTVKYPRPFDDDLPW